MNHGTVSLHLTIPSLPIESRTFATFRGIQTPPAYGGYGLVLSLTGDHRLKTWPLGEREKASFLIPEPAVSGSGWHSWVDTYTLHKMGKKGEGREEPGLG